MANLKKFENKLESGIINRDYKIAKIWRGSDENLDIFFSINEKGIKIYNKLIDKFNALDPSLRKIAYHNDSPNYLTQLIEFSLEDDIAIKNNRVFICAGEGFTLANDTQWINNSRYNINECTLIAGPYMLRNSKNRLARNFVFDWYGESNNTIDDLFCRQLLDKNLKLEVYSNIFPPLHNGFLGFFHFYTCNGAISVETYHTYDAHNKDEPTLKFMIKDIDLANEAEDYARDYAQYFANHVETAENLLGHFNSSEQEDYFDFYDINFIEEIKMRYAE